MFDGGLSTTEADKGKRYQLYLEKQLEEQLTGLDMVKGATVNLNL